MKALIILLLVAPLAHAEQFLEFSRHTHGDGTIHYTNVPNNQGANYINITGSANLKAHNEKQRRVKAYYEDKKAREIIKQRSITISGKIAQVGDSYILLSRNGSLLWVDVVDSSGLIDDQTFVSNVVRTGTKQYTAVTGATKTVASYQEVVIE